MVSPDPKPTARGSVIGYAAALSLAALGLVGRVLAAHAEGMSWIEVLSALALIVGGVLLLMVLLFELYALLIRRRTRTLAQSHPGAFIATAPPRDDPTITPGRCRLYSV